MKATMVCWSLLASSAALGLAASARAGSPPPLNGYIKDWVIVGPFDNPQRTSAADRGAFDTDYLVSLGGEAKARLRADTTVQVGGANVSAKHVHLAGTTLDFARHYPDSDHKLAYAYTEFTASGGTGFFYLGSDDGAKVFLNGKMVFETLPFPGRGYTARQDHGEVPLKKGVNTLLVKVENGSGDWLLGVEAYSGKKAEEIVAGYKRVETIRAFQNQELGLAADWPGYTFVPEYGGTPKIIWRDADAVHRLVGDVPLTVRWFDKDLNEVAEPKAPGRYAAYVEGKTKSGMVVRRALGFYCAPKELLDRFDDWGIDAPYFGSPIDANAWKEQSAIASVVASDLLRGAMIRSEAGANLLAALAEAQPNGGQAGVLDAADVRADDYQLALKLKLEGLAGKTRPLALPRTVPGAPAEVLHAGTPAEAGVKPDAKDRIDAVCRKWAEDSGEPFSILVARHGVIITNEAFGKAPNGTPITVDYRKDIASITKAISGILFSQFVDQGFVAVDDPIGKVLPDFPTKGPHTLTFRHLFTHTSGLQGHGEWGGIHNPYLENVILNGLDTLHPGEAHNYNGMGYDLAGKAMEAMTGKSIVRLFNENLFHPLGIGDIPMADLAYGARPTAYQLGALGQLLANHGRYGDKQFFSEETFAQMLPKNLSKWYPAVDVEWGLGLVWYRETKPGAPAGSKDPKDLILGEHVVGHGSSSSCILRVDLDHDLVIAQVRATAGPKYDQYLPQFLTAVADSLQ